MTKTKTNPQDQAQDTNPQDQDQDTDSQDQDKTKTPHSQHSCYFYG